MPPRIRRREGPSTISARQLRKGRAPKFVECRSRRWASLEPNAAKSVRARMMSSLYEKESRMLVLATPPLVFGAIGYSILYLLCGGGLMGAIVIFMIAKAMRR